MEKTNCNELFEAIFPFWDKISSSERDALCHNTTFRKYEKGRNIHGGTDECTGGIVVKSGVIRVYMLSEDGKEVTLYRLYDGDICMLSASCIIDAITFDVFVDAEEDTECYILNVNTFKAVMDNNIYVQNFVLNLTVTRFSDVMWIMQQIIFMSLDKRLAIFLYDEMNKCNSAKINLTQEQIAKYTGSAREVISRMLKYFATEGIAEAKRGSVLILDKEKLRALAVD